MRSYYELDVSCPDIDNVCIGLSPADSTERRAFKNHLAVGQWISPICDASDTERVFRKFLYRSR